MKFDPAKYHRRSVRLLDYDYTQSGAYFITICTKERECLFGEVIDGEMWLSKIGTVVGECWKAIPDHFPHVVLDGFVVMPNHIHGILMIYAEGRGTAGRAPTTERFSRPVAHSLSTAIRSFKAAVTRRVNELQGTSSTPVWQRNYYEHVIRNEEELHSLRQYTVDNPLKWALDQENPALRKPLTHGQK